MNIIKENYLLDAPITNPKHLVNKQYVDSIPTDIYIESKSGVPMPIGMIITTLWNKDVVIADSGIWLKCNGQEFDETGYSELFELLGKNTVPIIPSEEGANFYAKAQHGIILNKDVVGVSGNLESRILSANVWTTIKLIPTKGEIDTIDSDGYWICPMDGIYSLTIHPGWTGATGILQTRLQVNQPDSITVNNTIGLNSFSSEVFPSLSIQRLFNKNDKVSLHLFSSVNASGISGLNYFTIFLNSSIDITTWNLYEQWKERDLNRKDISFDEWIQLIFNQTTLRCGGFIEDMEITTSTSNYPFVFNVTNGDPSINQGNGKLIAPISGLYVLTIGSTQLNTMPSETQAGIVIVEKRAVDDTLITRVARNDVFGHGTGSYILPAFTVVQWLEKGQSLRCLISSMITQSTIKKSTSYDFVFEFALISPQQGKDGQSAYEIAIDNGFIGTEEEWLENLIGEEGKEIVVADALDYPVGWQQVTAWTDDVVHTNHGVWLKCNGQKIDINQYLELLETSAISSSQEKITPNMTNNTTPTPYVISASSQAAVGDAPWHAFDGIAPGDCWASAVNTFPAPNYIGDQWIQVDLGAPNRVTYYILRSRGVNWDGNALGQPSNWKILGSNDESSWDVLDTQQDIPSVATKYSIIGQFNIMNPGNYRYYRLNVTKLSGAPTAGLLTLGELELYTDKVFQLISLPFVNNQYTYIKAKNNHLTNNELEQQRAMLQWANAELNKEYWTGKRYIDGKKIYGKKIDFGNLPAENASKTVPHNISNYEVFISITGMANTNVHAISLPMTSPTVADINLIDLYPITHIRILNGNNDRSHFTAIITLEYTCTDR